MSRLPKPPHEYHLPLALAYIDGIKSNFSAGRKDVHDALKYISDILKDLESQNNEYRGENKIALDILQSHPNAVTVNIEILPEILEFFESNPIIFAKKTRVIVVFEKKSEAILCKLKWGENIP